MSSIIDSPKGMITLLDTLVNLPTDPPSLYLDIEGINLGRHGSISIIELLVAPQNHVYLIDVHVLRALAFSTKSVTTGETFQSILESPSIPKVFFDVRNDSDALHGHFGIRLAGVVDLQLLENATRPGGRRTFVSGLMRCIERDAPMTYAEKEAWQVTKERGRRLFAPELGGSYAVFDVRPVTQQIREYCVQDVLFLPGLWTTYMARLSRAWAEKVRVATLDRVALSQTAGYNGKGRHQALGPWG